jgi:hypothetical protein
LNQDRGLVKNPNSIFLNDKIVIPDFCSFRQGCARADDCPTINASVCSPGTCAEDDPSFVCSCTAPGVESSGVPACGGRYLNDTCVTGCKMSDPCRSFSCVNAVCSSDGGVPRCTCLPGFVRQNPNLCADACIPNPCSGGTCEHVATGAQFKCVCGPGFVLSTDTTCVSVSLPSSTTKQPTTTTTTTTTTTAQSTKTTTTRPSSTTSATPIAKSTTLSGAPNSGGGETTSNGTASVSNITASSNLGADTVSDGDSSTTTIAIVVSVVGVMLLALIGAFVFWWRSKSAARESTSDSGIASISIGAYGAVPRTDVAADVNQSNRYGAAPHSSDVAAIPPPATYDVAPPEQPTLKNHYTPAPSSPWQAT